MQAQFREVTLQEENAAYENALSNCENKIQEKMQEADLLQGKLEVSNNILNSYLDIASSFFMIILSVSCYAHNCLSYLVIVMARASVTSTFFSKKSVWAIYHLLHLVRVPLQDDISGYLYPGYCSSRFSRSYMCHYVSLFRLMFTGDG